MKKIIIVLILLVLFVVAIRFAAPAFFYSIVPYNDQPVDVRELVAQTLGQPADNIEIISSFEISLIHDGHPDLSAAVRITDSPVRNVILLLYARTGPSAMRLVARNDEILGTGGNSDFKLEPDRTLLRNGMELTFSQEKGRCVLYHCATLVQNAKDRLHIEECTTDIGIDIETATPALIEAAVEKAEKNCETRYMDGIHGRICRMNSYIYFPSTIFIISIAGGRKNSTAHG